MMLCPSCQILKRISWLLDFHESRWPCLLRRAGVNYKAKPSPAGILSLPTAYLPAYPYIIGVYTPGFSEAISPQVVIPPSETRRESSEMVDTGAWRKVRTIIILLFGL